MKILRETCKKSYVMFLPQVTLILKLTIIIVNNQWIIWEIGDGLIWVSIDDTSNINS